MATAFYWHSAASTVGGTLPTAWDGTWDGGNSVFCRSMNSTVGNSGTSTALLTGNNTNPQSASFNMFVSEPLAAHTNFDLGTMTIAYGASESNAASNFFVRTRIYIWRPSTGASVGLITDLTDATEATGGWYSQGYGGLGLFTCQAGDVLVVETGRGSAVQSMATSYTNTISYDGTNDAETNAASRITFSGNLTFLVNHQGTTFTPATRPFFAVGDFGSGIDATSDNVPLPVGWQAGDLAVMSYSAKAASGATTPSIPSGWTGISSGSSNGVFGSFIAYRRLAAGDTSWTVNHNFTATNSLWALAVFRNAARIDLGTGGVNVSYSTAFNADASEVSAQANSLAVLAVASESSGSPTFSPSNMTYRAGAGAPAGASIYTASVEATSFDPASVTLGVAAQWRYAVFLLYPADAVEPTPTATLGAKTIPATANAHKYTPAFIVDSGGNSVASGSPTSIGVSMPTCAAGDYGVIVCEFFSASAASWGAPAGWSAADGAENNDAAGGHFKVFVKDLNGSESGMQTVTFGVAAETAAISCVVIRHGGGTLGTTPFGAGNNYVNQTSLALQPGNYNLTAPEPLLYVAATGLTEATANAGTNILMDTIDSALTRYGQARATSTTLRETHTNILVSTPYTSTYTPAAATSNVNVYGASRIHQFQPLPGIVPTPAATGAKVNTGTASTSANGPGVGVPVNVSTVSTSTSGSTSVGTSFGAGDAGKLGFIAVCVGGNTTVTMTTGGWTQLPGYGLPNSEFEVFYKTLSGSDSAFATWSGTYMAKAKLFTVDGVDLADPIAYRVVRGGTNATTGLGYFGGTDPTLLNYRTLLLFGAAEVTAAAGQPSISDAAEVNYGGSVTAFGGNTMTASTSLRDVCAQVAYANSLNDVLSGQNSATSTVAVDWAGYTVVLRPAAGPYATGTTSVTHFGDATSTSPRTTAAAGASTKPATATGTTVTRTTAAAATVTRSSTATAVTITPTPAAANSVVTKPQTAVAVTMSPAPVAALGAVTKTQTALATNSARTTAATPGAVTKPGTATHTATPTVVSVGVVTDQGTGSITVSPTPVAAGLVTDLGVGLTTTVSPTPVSAGFVLDTATATTATSPIVAATGVTTKPQTAVGVTVSPAPLATAGAITRTGTAAVTTSPTTAADGTAWGIQYMIPDAILAMTGLTGVVANIQDSPNSPDATELAATGGAIDVRFSFENHDQLLRTLANDQTVRIRVTAI